MHRETLIDFFDDFVPIHGTFLLYDDGFRTRAWTYAEVGRDARRLADRLRSAGVQPGDKVVLWAENRPEWIVALWGCILHGAILVPIDYRASADFLARVRAIVDARLVLVGDDVDVPPGLLGDTVQIARLRELGADLPPAAPGTPSTGRNGAPTRDTIVEIIFTSGATAEPKGVVITHRNILANIVPIEREARKYRRYARPFAPIRFLNLLPMSHMFGQAMATFIPPMIDGQVVFMRSYNPQEIVQQIRSRRISVLVSVPKILDVLRGHVVRRHPVAASPEAAPMHWLRRWWRYREVHRAFGWKFWAAIVGAAPLDPELEEYWSRLGYLVVQGYGLTETAPIVTLNHPFSTRRGSVGRPIAGVEIKLADDGEILVRGENVTAGYYGAPESTAAAFEDGWLHTGDIGGMDEQGRVYIRGRRKEMIVTPEGLNVFPEDIERALLRADGVRDAAVVGRTVGGQERVHAVLLLEPGAEPDAIVRAVNPTLADHQKIRSTSVWPGDALPRTEGTRKLRRAEVKRWVDEGGPPPAGAAAGGPAAAGIVAALARREDVTPETTIEELGLSSLERVELLMALEEHAGRTLDEGEVAAARTVADLEALLKEEAQAGAAVEPAPDRAAPAGGAGVASEETRRAGAAAAAEGPVKFPRWNRTWPAWMARRVSLPTWILPLASAFARVEVTGLEHLRGVEGPVVFAANHQSHMDTPAVLIALPPRWRYRVTVAMAKEFFKAHFFPEQYGRRAWLTNSLNYYLASLFFNAFPLPQREAGTRQTLRYIGALLGEGYSVLIFPEGKRTQAGEINPFRPGIGMIAARLDVPVIPVGLSGLHQILHQSWKMARPGRARVAFGPPLRLEGDDYVALAKQVEEAVRLLVH